MAKESNPIEEEVQDIIGVVPPKVVRYGNGVILSILITLFGISCMIPCKDTEEVNLRMQKAKNCYWAEAEAPAMGYGNLYVGQSVQIDVDCFPSSEYGFMQGTITMLDTIMTGDGYKVRIYVPFLQSSFRSDKRLQEMSGRAFIIISEYRLIDKIFRYK